MAPSVSRPYATAVLLDGEQARRQAGGARFFDRSAGRQTATVGTSRLEDTALTRAALSTTFSHAQPPGVRGPVRRTAVVVGDLLGAVAIVFCVPVVILAIGTPIALGLRLLLWIGGLL